MTHMDRVGVREMRQNLSRFLERVEEGESFEITARGHPIARLVPSSARSPELARLVGRYGVIPPERPRSSWPRALKAPAGTPSSAEILEDLRGERL